MPKLPEVLSAVHKVRLRLRLQTAMQGLVYGLLVGAVLLFIVVLLRRFGVFAAPVLRSIPLLATGLGLFGVFGALGFALRRIDPLTVAARIDKSHELHDRLASALQFVGVGSTPALDPQKELRELAIADAERVAQGIVPSRAAPFRRPARLGWLGLALLAVVAAWSLRMPRPNAPIEAPKKRPLPADPRLTIESDLLEPEKEELRELIKQAEQAGDKEALELLKQMQKLLEQVERGEISRKQAFEMLAELERRLAAKAQEGALEELKERLRKAGSELGESKLAKDVGQALLKEDLEKAQKELKKLAAEALSKATKNAKSKEEKDALSKAFDRAAEAMRQQNQKSDKDKTGKTDKDKQNERDLDKQKDEWKDKTRSEELTRRMQELKDEERRLKKKLEQNPNDEETERRLKKNQRELEQLEKEKQEREEARRELEQLQRDMQRAAEEMRKQLEKMTPEQRKALEKMAEDLQRMQQQMKQMQQRGQGQQQMRSQMTVALGSIKQVLRRIARSGQGQDGQGQGQGQQGQGQGQNGQGQGQNGQGQSMKDYMNRAKGKGGGGESDVLVEGDGSDKDGQKMMILGQGNDPVIIPGLGGGQGNDKGQGQQGMGQGGEKPGNEHDPNMLGNATQIDSKRRLTRVYGKEAAGPTRSETILGAAEKGFATQPYRRVYRDYSAVSEKVMSQQRVPPGYRFYVKRYFQMIKPRE